MKEIFKTISKYTFPIIVVFVLLFIQASCDLSLPDYTSKIINIGIQQGGIENSALKVISQSEFDKLLLFTNKEEKEILKNSYDLVTKDNGDVKKYPLLNSENIYVLNDATKEEQLDAILRMPTVLVYTLGQDDFDKTQIFGDKVIPDMDIFEMLKMMSEEDLTKLVVDMKAKFEDYESNMLSQISVMYVKGEYQHIGINVDKIQMDYIVIRGLKMLGLALLAMVIAVVTTFISSKIAAKLGRDLRSKVVNKVMTYANNEFEYFQTSSLITRSTNDIQQVQMLVVMLIRIVFYAPIVGIGALNKVSGSDMSWVIGLAVLMIISIVIILFIVAMPKFNIVQKLIDKLNLVSREILTGIPVIRAFSNEAHEEKRFDKANKDLTKVNLFVNKVMTVMMPTMMFIMNGICILIVWVGASKINLGTMQIGTLMAFITYTMQIIMAFLMISMVSIMVPRAIVSMKRIGEVLSKEPSIKDPIKPLTFNSSNGVIEFKDVYFRYPDAVEDVLEDINFTAKPGTTTAFIGSTGSGKSTLINLIPRFFDVTGGKILIDGINIKDVKLKDLRSKIGYVPQKGMLFTGTIESNIGLGLENMDKEQMEKATRISQASEFVNDKKDKYNSEISQGGTNVSGGQRQRLAIARAIAIDPDIYIFDDSFSALDYKTDAKLRKALAKETSNKTILIVAQRISTVMNAEKIIVLDNGHIVGCGTHKELMDNCEVYKEIALSQLSKEELLNEE
ncbi:MAG: ABC transporter ATP-binding protein [Bacilli bacterium]